MDKILVALVEDEAGTRQRLEQALALHADIELIFSASTEQDILAWLKAPAPRAPDVLLVDLGLPDGSGIEVIARCAQLCPQTDCMVVTMFGDEANMIRAFEAGAKGYLLKDGNPQALSEHVMQLSQGGSPMSPIIARQLLSRMAADREPASTQALVPSVDKAVVSATQSTLTKREHEILQYISRGYTYPELARYLSIGQTTVLSHVRSIYGKLSVHNKTEAVYEARALGLLD